MALAENRGVLAIDISDALLEARHEGFENRVVEIDHAYMFSGTTLAAMVQKAGFEIVKSDVVDTRHVFWGNAREPQPKQIRIAARKSLQPVEIAWPDPLDELATLLRHELGRGRDLRLRDAKARAKRADNDPQPKRSKKVRQTDQSGAKTAMARVWSRLTGSRQPVRLRK